MLMNYTKACNPYSKFFAPVNGTSAIGCAEKAIFSGIFRHVSHYRLCIKDGRKIDPAAGSGNFLTETYLSIRRLENEAIEAMEHGQMMIGEVKNPIKVCPCSTALRTMTSLLPLRRRRSGSLRVR